MDARQSFSIPIFVSDSDRHDVEEPSLYSKGDFDEELVPVSVFIDELKHDNFEVTYIFKLVQRMTVNDCDLLEGKA